MPHQLAPSVTCCPGGIRSLLVRHEAVIARRAAANRERTDLSHGMQRHLRAIGAFLTPALTRLDSLVPTPASGIALRALLHRTVVIERPLIARRTS